MPHDPHRSEHPWARKFRNAFRGVKEGIYEQSSFRVHSSVAVAVIAAAAALGVSLVEWCLLLLCIAGVFTAELFNSALESTAKAITGKSNPHVRDALDIGSAAVLVASVGASLVGTIIFARRLGILLGWW